MKSNSYCLDHFLPRVGNGCCWRRGPPGRAVLIVGGFGALYGRGVTVQPGLVGAQRSRVVVRPHFGQPRIKTVLNFPSSRKLSPQAEQFGRIVGAALVAVAGTPYGESDVGVLGFEGVKAAGMKRAAAVNPE